MDLSKAWPTRVRVVEVAPRDGLQNITSVVPTGVKIAFIRALTAAGLSNIEASSFVAPRAIPQLADASDVFASLRSDPHTGYSALVPNLRGMERAIDAGARQIALFTAASESFALRNINMTVERSLAEFTRVCALARQSRIPVRAYISTAFFCPFEGAIKPEAVRVVAARLLDMGVFEISVADTIGAATPLDVETLLTHLFRDMTANTVAVHFHDTRGTALANVLTALRLGVTTVDSAAGGLGGCPYAPGAAGNLATEDLLYMLHGMGIGTGVDLTLVCAATKLLADATHLRPTSKMFQAWSADQVSLLPIIST